MKKHATAGRRTFMKEAALVSAGIMTTPLVSTAGPATLKEQQSIYLIGPQNGYSPQIGTLLSTMTMMRKWVIDTVKNLSVEQLDFQLDEKSNSVGAMLLHLAATERYYQLHTFDGLEWGTWSDDIKQEWDVASALGETAREQIKGNKLEFYLKKLEEVREITRKEFARRDDEWIMQSDLFFENQPTNNYCKWFHVCEHESNHRGQMKFIISRLPK